MVKLLLKAGADVNATNNSGISALDEAAFYGRDTVATTLLEYGANVNQLGYRDLATPLMVAAVHGNAGVAKFLLEFGANADATDRAGQTPLQIAQKLGWSNVCDLDQQAIKTTHIRTQ